MIKDNSQKFVDYEFNKIFIFLLRLIVVKI